MDQRSGKASLHADVTAQIIAELETGRLPWVQPWETIGLPPGLPRNAVSGRHYSGINVLLLWLRTIEQGHASHGWLTYRQCARLGGQVRRGEHGSCVIYVDRRMPRGEEARAVEEEREARQVLFLRRFVVFNADQCDGLPTDMAGARVVSRESNGVASADGFEVERDPLADGVIAATGADFRIGGDRAYYAPGGDYVQVPLRELYRHPLDWYRTAFHELGHWTGHASRLAREQGGRFGDAWYAREELVAEMTSAFVCAELGITPSVRHADYLGAWLDLLRADDRAILRAAGQASRAAALILPSEDREDDGHDRD